MRTMNDYNNFPPIRYFERVLKVAPESALLYVQIWKSKNEEMKTIKEKKDIRKEFVITPTKFRNLLQPLIYLGLLSLEDADEKYSIHFSGPIVND